MWYLLIEGYSSITRTLAEKMGYAKFDTRTQKFENMLERADLIYFFGEHKL